MNDDTCCLYTVIQYITFIPLYITLYITFKKCANDLTGLVLSWH